MKSFTYDNFYTWIIALSVPLGFISLLFLVPSVYYGDFIYHISSKSQAPLKFQISEINSAVILWIFSFVCISALLLAFSSIIQKKIKSKFKYDLIPIKRSFITVISFGIFSYFIFHQIFVLPAKIEHIFHQGMLFFYVAGALAGFLFIDCRRGTLITFATICVWVVLVSLVTMFTGKLLAIITFLCSILFGSLLRTSRFYSFKTQCLTVLVMFTAVVLLVGKYIVRKDCYFDRPFERISITANKNQISSSLAAITNCAQMLTEMKVGQRVQTDLTTSISNDREGRLNHNSALSSRSSSMELFLERVVRRVSHLKYLGRVMHEVKSENESIGYSHYSKIFSALVPRFLWPDKPRFVNSNEFGRKFQFIKQTDYVTSVNLDVITEAWIVDRWYGVVCSASIVSVLVFLVWFGSTFFTSWLLKTAVLTLIPINTFALESGLGAFSLGIIQQSCVLFIAIFLLLRFKFFRSPSL